jgi:hypothetical protein
VEAVVDKIIQEMEELSMSPDFEDIVEIKDVKWGDPGVVMTDEYPYFYVDPVADVPKSETLGLAGWDRRTLTVSVGLVVNAADYFDPAVSESPGLRQLVQAMGLVRKRLRRLSKSGLDGEAGPVNNVVVGSTNYIPEVRNTTFVRLAVTTLAVDKTYQHED